MKQKVMYSCYCLKLSCEVASPYEDHYGPIRRYDSQTYRCSSVNEDHTFCQRHSEMRNCPIHTTGFTY